MKGVRKVMRPRFTFGHGPTPYNYDQDEVLHREGEWSLRKSRFPEAEWMSYIHHRVEKNILQQNPWIDGKKPDPPTYLKKIGCEWSDLPLRHNRCTKCLNTIPEGILGLWTMHNWDMLQNNHIITGRQG
jgi:hypothetical protein